MTAVHDLHVWAMSATRPALTAHRRANRRGRWFPLANASAGLRQDLLDPPRYICRSRRVHAAPRNMPTLSRRIVLISGAPGAGKTTVALPLAAQLGWPLISKDHQGNVSFDAMGGIGGGAFKSPAALAQARWRRSGRWQTAARK